MLLFRSIRAAFIFLTRIPLGGFPYSAEEWRWSTAHFPLVGAGLGVLLAGLWWFFAPIIGPWPTAFLIIGIICLLTGGFHEDGLADTYDALGGAYAREQLLEILKDSRIGSFGAIALFVVLGFRASALATLPPESVIWILAFAQVGSRMFPIWLMVALPYATSDSESKSRQVTRAGPWQAIVATGWTLFAAALLVGLGTLSLPFLLISLGLGLALTLFLGWRFYQRAGGVTGDFLGATQQLCEVAIYLAAFATLRFFPT